MPPKKAAKKAAKKAPEQAPEQAPEPELRLKGKPHEHEDNKHHDKKHSEKKHGDKKHHDKKHHEGKDLRRAYEHLGRLSALEKNITGRTVTQIKTLTDLAQSSVLADDPKSAADLLRAAEHLAFGSLAQTSRAARLSDALEATLNAEFDHLIEKAAEHWQKHEVDRPAEIADIYNALLAIADTARTKGAYRRALEFARGAEALAHVRGTGTQNPGLLEDGDDDEMDLLEDRS